MCDDVGGGGDVRGYDVGGRMSPPSKAMVVVVAFVLAAVVVAGAIGVVSSRWLIRRTLLI